MLLTLIAFVQAYILATHHHMCFYLSFLCPGLWRPSVQSPGSHFAVRPGDLPVCSAASSSSLGDRRHGAGAHVGGAAAGRGCRCWQAAAADLAGATAAVHF